MQERRQKNPTADASADEQAGRTDDTAVHTAEVAAAGSADLLAKGEAVYLANCSACHQPDGTGLVGAFPPLAESDYLLGDRKEVIGAALFGESMYSEESNASKFALVFLDKMLTNDQLGLIDGQIQSPHLVTLGARSLPRDEFAARLEQLNKQSGTRILMTAQTAAMLGEQLDLEELGEFQVRSVNSPMKLFSTIEKGSACQVSSVH